MNGAIRVRYDKERADAFREANQGEPFTMVNNEALAAQILDSRCPKETRVLSCIWIHSWGNQSPYAIDGYNGQPIGQAEFAGILQLNKGTVSRMVDRLERKCQVRREGRRLIPMKNPEEARQTAAVQETKNLRQHLLAEYFAARPAELQELQQHEAAAKAIRLRALAAVKRTEKLHTSQLSTLEPTELLSQVLAETPDLNSEKLQTSQLLTPNSNSKMVEHLTTFAPESCDSPQPEVADGSNNLLPPDATNEGTLLIEETEDVKTLAGTSSTNLPLSSLALPEPFVKVSSAISQMLTDSGIATDDAACRQLVRESLDAVPDATRTEILRVLAEKIPNARQNRAIQNPMGFLIRAVPRYLASEQFRQRRRQLEAEQRAREFRKQPSREEELRSLLSDPQVSEDEKRLARLVLGASAGGQQ